MIRFLLKNIFGFIGLTLLGLNVSAQNLDSIPNARDWTSDILKYLKPEYADSINERDSLMIMGTLAGGLERFYPSGSVADYGKDLNNPYRRNGGASFFKSGVNDIFNWSNVGPSSPTSTSDGIGRIHRIFIHPKYHSGKPFIYACTPYGGLWKYNGQTWSVLSENINADESKNLLYTGVSDVFVHPVTEWLYIASGGNDNVYDNYKGSFEFSPVYTQGLYRSKDEGLTWEKINSGIDANYNNWGHFEQLVLNPHNSEEAFAIGTHGVHRCSNLSDPIPIWSKIFTGTFPLNYMSNEIIRGIAFHPTDPNIFYVSGRKIYRTLDGGVNWQDYQEIYPDFKIVEPGESLIRVNIDVDPGDPDQLAVLVAYRNSGNNKSKKGGFVKNGIWGEMASDDINLAGSSRLTPVRFNPGGNGECLFGDRWINGLGGAAYPVKWTYHMDV
ncbi:MAG: hypothetical protein ACI9YL_002129, partial [Luteibaculaceae bacterium]